MLPEPIIAQKAPYPTPVEAGKTYYWCVCGQSSRQPLCDGSHKDSGFAPLPFTPSQDATAYLCGCKATKNAPYCDGSHARL
jgi:CDGSH-type Zn-finger protein